jgi:hypothetical protein
MPTLAEATSVDTSNLEPVQKTDKPAGGPPQTYPSAPNPFLRATVPQVGNSGPDGQRSYFNGGKVPQTRVPILQQLGNPF